MDYLNNLLKSSPFIPIQKGNGSLPNFWLYINSNLPNLLWFTMGKKSLIFCIPPSEGDLGGGMF